MESFDALTQDLIDAEGRVSAINFDKYEEQFSFKVLKGIQLNDFNTVVNRVASRYNFPEDVKESILDGELAGKNQEIMKEFKFNIGQTGRVLYGRTMTLKQEDKIDMAYALIAVKFKLSPVQSVRQEDKYFLFWKVGEKTIVTSKDRNLSIQEADGMTKFFRAKAIRGFQQECPALK